MTRPVEIEKNRKKEMKWLADEYDGITSTSHVSVRSALKVQENFYTLFVHFLAITTTTQTHKHIISWHHPPYHHINIRHHPTLSFFISFYIFFPLSKEKVRLEDLDVGIEAKKYYIKEKVFFLLLFQFLDYILHLHFFSLYLPSANHVIYYDDASFQVSVYVIFIVLPG